jgi:poly-gamma-glutamate synthesis protein (capsule biosynthesis protein)
VDFPYIWRDAVEESERVAPDLRLTNLEISMTRVKYCFLRMYPKNTLSITAAKIDLCSLANNHAFDWVNRGKGGQLQLDPSIP